MDQHFEPSPPGAPSPVFGFDLSNWIAWLMDAAGRGRVRGEDQLFSYKEALRENVQEANADAGNNWLDFTAVPAGEIWVVTSVHAYDLTSSPTKVAINVIGGGITTALARILNPAADEGVPWNGHAYLEEGESVQVWFAGCTAGDFLDGAVHGYKMTLET